MSLKAVFGAKPWKTRFVRQTSAADCGHACICMLLSSIGIHASLLSLVARYPVGLRGMSVKELLDVLRMSGAKARAMRASGPGLTALIALGRPVIAHLAREHFVVVASATNDKVHLLDPASGEFVIAADTFLEQWSGVFVTAEGSGATRARPHPSEFSSLLRDMFRENGFVWSLLVALIAIMTVVAVSVPIFLTRSLMTLGAAAERHSAQLLLALGFFTVAILAGHWLRARLSLAIQLQVDKRLTATIVRRILRLPVRLFAVLSAGDLLSRVHALSSVRDFLSHRLSTLVLDVGMIAATTGLIWYLDARIAAVYAALTLLLTLCLACGWSSYGRKVEAEVLANSAYQSTLAETLGAGLDIKVNRKEGTFERRLLASFAAYQGKQEATATLAARFDPLFAFQERFVPIVAVLAPFALYPNGAIQGLTAVYCYFLLTLACPAIRSLQGFMMSLVMVRLNIERMESLEGLGQEPQETPASSCSAEQPTTLSAQEISFSYLGTGAPVLSNVSAHFRADRLNVVIGESGAGKSTLLRALAGLVPVDSGKVVAANKAGTLPSLGHAAYLNQHPTIFAGTVIDNICMFEPEPDLAWAEECARLACIDAEIARLPQGFQTWMVAGGTTLSAGQCQRIAIARLLYTRAPIMLLDEFTSDIDPETERRIVGNLRSVGSIRVVVTHRTGWIQPEDHVVALSGAPRLPSNKEMLDEVSA